MLPFAVLFLATQSIVRVTLAWRVGADDAESAVGLLTPFLLGGMFDVAVFTVFAIPIVLWWLVLPSRLKGGRVDRWATILGVAIFAFLCPFTAVAEPLFWAEFGTRFNFIAVDYLVYAQEVIANIRQSYPVTELLVALALVSLGAAYLGRRWYLPAPERTPMSARLAPALAALALPALLVGATPISLALGGSNAYAKELSLNGIWALVDAFFNNEIDYRRFYRTLDDRLVGSRIEKLLTERNTRLAAPGQDHLTRIVKREGPMLRKNVMLISMESMGAEYLAHFGNTQGVTPNLDRLADDGLLFANLLATGTRTVRGLEALTLSGPAHARAVDPAPTQQRGPLHDWRRVPRSRLRHALPLWRIWLLRRHERLLCRQRLRGRRPHAVRHGRDPLRERLGCLRRRSHRARHQGGRQIVSGR
jgi:phosphoglycerol transferase MdoB-like AlkP superfamily enzyme